MMTLKSVDKWQLNTIFEERGCEYKELLSWDEIVIHLKMGNGMTKETLSTLTDHLPVLMNYHCAMIGLDYSGKTTVLYRLKYNQYMNAAPTIGFNCEKVCVIKYRNV